MLQVVLDGKKALKDELQISASISSPTSGHKRVSTANIRLDLKFFHKCIYNVHVQIYVNVA